MGNTACARLRPGPRPVHPHTHGEHLIGKRVRGLTPGSSPHAWGTRMIKDLMLISPRFIPTRMGNTCHIPVYSSAHTVHPHTHGEHRGGVDGLFFAHGSSPHAWGTRLANQFCTIRCRFIPTRMGNTDYSINLTRELPVHPHTHGEHTCFACASGVEYGSSPHAWGTLVHSYTTNFLHRFIPTRMGNTLINPLVDIMLLVHPHTHGEHCVSIY